MEGQQLRLPKENENGTNSNIQHTTQKTKDLATRTPQKFGMSWGAHEGQAVLFQM